MKFIGNLVEFLYHLPVRLIDILAGIVCMAFGLLIHPVVACFVVPVVTYYTSPSTALLSLPFWLGLLAIISADKVTGKLPGWAFMWETPDEPLPGDLREPFVAEYYVTHGWFGTSVYWLLERNRGHGLAFALGRYLPDGKQLDGDKWGFQELSNGAWRVVLNLGVCQLGFGNQTTLKKGVGIYAIPWFTLKRIKGATP